MIEQVRQWLGAARRVAVLTGAGMSAESGVPTFRDAQTGLWAKFDPQQLATEEAFRANPAMVWDWYAFRREMIARVEPNAGHRALAAFAAAPSAAPDADHAERGWPAPAGRKCRRAGLARQHHRGQVAGCAQGLLQCKPAAAGSPPYCKGCGNMRRPAVVWFGEALPLQTLVDAEAAAQECDLMLVVGTSGVVYPAAGLARIAQGKVVIINPEPTELDDAADAVLRGKAAQLLPQLLED